MSSRGASRSFALASMMAAGVGVATLIAGAWPAMAHHSFIIYEATRKMTLEGTVKSFQWTNPHCEIVILALPPDGAAAQEWTIETAGPGVLTRAGWTRQSLNIGDRVRVEFSPLRDGSHGGGLTSVTLIDTGQILVPSLNKHGPG
jgi:hydrogenase maturation factor